MTMRVLAFSLCALALAACGSSSNNGTDATAGGSDAGTGGGGGGGAGGGGGMAAATKVTVTGVAAPHPLTMPLMATADFSNMAIAIVDPVVFLAKMTTLAQGPLDTTAGNCQMGACAWSLMNVDVSNLVLGLVAIVDDLRPAGMKQWVRTGTGIGTPDEVTAMTKNGTLGDRRAFAVSKMLEAKLAAFVSAVSGTMLSAADLEARGFMIGTVVGKLSDGAKPVAGAKVTPMAADKVDVYYPNDTFMGKQDTTGATGTVIVVPKAAMPAPVVTTWPVTPPSGDPRAWPLHSAGTQPGAAFILIFAAKE
jgi:hypothetical protein